MQDFELPTSVGVSLQSKCSAIVLGADIEEHGRHVHVALVGFTKEIDAVICMEGIPSVNNELATNSNKDRNYTTHQDVGEPSGLAFHRRAGTLPGGDC